MSAWTFSSGRYARVALASAAVLGVAGAIGMAAAPSCQTYAPPPTATIEGLSDGILKNPMAPIVVQFSTPVDPDTINVQIAPFNIDAYGNLPDEEPDAGPLNALTIYDAKESVHVNATLSSDHTTLTLTPTPLAWLPTGPSLVLLVGAGLTSSTTGTVLHYRERLLFSYPAVCGEAKPTKFLSGAYFFILEVTKPVAVPLKTFAAIDVNPLTGEFYGQFTAAVRNPDPSRCNPPCTGGTACELIPSPAKCVEVSTPPADLEEYPDYVFKSGAPNGYTFEMHGCATNVGDAGAVNILTQPGVLNVSSPAVSIQGLTFTAQFVPVDGGLVMGSGSLTATKSFLGTFPAGPGTGTLSALSIPDAAAPADLPQPGTENDAGADAGDAAADGDSDSGSDGG
jgi:hypothetical protein